MCSIENSLNDLDFHGTREGIDTTEQTNSHEAILVATWKVRLLQHLVSKIRALAADDIVTLDTHSTLLITASL